MQSSDKEIQNKFLNDTFIGKTITEANVIVKINTILWQGMKIEFISDTRNKDFRDGRLKVKTDQGFITELLEMS